MEPLPSSSRPARLSFASLPPHSAAERAAKSSLDEINSDLQLDRYPKIDPNRIVSRRSSSESSSLNSLSAPELSPAEKKLREKAECIRSLSYDESSDCHFFPHLFSKKKKPREDSHMLIVEVLKQEIEATEEGVSLFRLDGNYSKILNFWLRTTQREWYKKIFPPEFFKKLESEDISHIQKAEELFDNLSNSLDAEGVILSLLKSVRDEAATKFREALPTNFIYCFLFLRFINPCLMNPVLYGLPSYRGSVSGERPPPPVVTFMKLLQSQASKPLPDEHEAAASLNPRRQHLIALIQLKT